MLAGAACVVLMGVVLLASAATSPELPNTATYDIAVDRAVTAFYASHGGGPLWLKNGSAARDEIHSVAIRAVTLPDRDSCPIAAWPRLVMPSS